MIICRSCRAEAHPLREGYYATGCDCVPLQLVKLPDEWDAFVQAVNAKAAAVERATDEVERQFKGIIATRKQQFLDAMRRQADA
jgi:hypothetical protein